MNYISAIRNVNTTEYTERAENTARPEAPAASPAVQSGADFSSTLADAMRDSMMRNTISAGSGLTGLPGGFMPMQDDGLEQAMIAAAASGEIGDTQIALFMLMMMMQSNLDGDFSMIMQAMAAMLTQLQPQGERAALRDNVMSSHFEPFVLDEIDRHVFNWRTPENAGRGQVILPLEAWRPTTPAVTSNVNNRSPERYRTVVDQFRVETAERYRPFRNGSTYCNIFVWDVTRAMGAELPHYTDPATGAPRFYPDIRGARSMGAIATCQWLRTHGPTYGWREVDAETAQMHANQGRPAITSAGSLGHVQVVVPSRDGGFDPVRGVTIAQAGRINTNFTHISSIYGGNALRNQVRYWIHD
jgi:hypothetical protein